MFRTLSAFILTASVSSAIYAQTTPAPQSPEENRAPQILSQVFSGAGGSYLGVQMKEVTKDNFSELGLRQVRGAAVEKVLENSPAAQAGLQTGDVIVRFNDTDVTGVRQLTRLISEVAPDHQARITVLRGGSERQITATVGKREVPQMFQTGKLNNFYDYDGALRLPNLPGIPASPNAPMQPFGDGESNVFVYGQSRQIGVGVSPLNEQLGNYFGVASGKGLLVNNVRENSPAAKAGLKAGDIIVEVEGKTIASSHELIRALSAKKEGDVNLTIVRDKNRQTVRVNPETVKGGTFNFNEGFPKFDGFAEPMKFEAPFPPIAPIAPLGAPRVL